mmetsp:Transcript_55703/g.158650  ORF Transcript_55703/g.158650 Transcript_55703/m.158650 type:complete len:324 (+) Transcript_55703:197-1168(+)
MGGQADEAAARSLHLATALRPPRNLLLEVLQVPAVPLDVRLPTGDGLGLGVAGLLLRGGQVLLSLLRVSALLAEVVVRLAHLLLQRLQAVLEGGRLGLQGLRLPFQDARVARALQQPALVGVHAASVRDALLVHFAPGLFDHAGVLCARPLLLASQQSPFLLQLLPDLLHAPAVLGDGALVLALERAALLLQLPLVLLRLGLGPSQLLLQPRAPDGGHLVGGPRAPHGGELLGPRLCVDGLQLLQLRLECGRALRQGGAARPQRALAPASGLGDRYGVLQLRPHSHQLRLPGLALPERRLGRQLGLLRAPESVRHRGRQLVRL